MSENFLFVQPTRTAPPNECKIRLNAREHAVLHRKALKNGVYATNQVRKRRIIAQFSEIREIFAFMFAKVRYPLCYSLKV